MRDWRLAVALALAALGLQGCDRSPPVTTVVPPTASLPDDAVLTPGAQPAAQAAASAPAAPVAAAPAEPAPAPDTQAMGAPAGSATAPAAATPATPAQAPQGSAAPTELWNLTQPSGAASGPASAASSPEKVSSALPQVRNPGDAQGARLLAQRSLQVPVAGIAPASLSDNYEQSRGQRTHEAIDILAPTGTPVVAVDDGRITKLFTSKAGGLTIYQYDTPGQLAYYYAHLQRYAAGVREGMDVRRGQLIGYVGSTGNADPGAPHLHFSVFRLGTPAKWWQGEAVNPYPALSRAAPADQVASR